MSQSIQQVQSNIEEEDSINLAKYFNFLTDHFRFIACITLAAVLLGGIYALIAKPVYETNILIKVEGVGSRPKNVIGDLSSPAEGNQDIKFLVSSEMEVLRSRSVISRAIDSGHFYIDVQPKYFPGIGAWIAGRNKQLSEPGLFGYGGYVWGSEQANVSAFNVPEALEGKTFLLTAEGGNTFRLTQEETGIEAKGRVGETLKFRVAQGEIALHVDQLAANPGAQFLLTRAERLETIENLQKALKISEKGKQSGVIEVRLDGADPKRISQVLNQVGREYIRQNVDQKSEEAQKTLVFLATQLPQVKQQLEGAEKSYNELRNSSRTIDIGEEAKNILHQSFLAQTRMAELRQKKEELLTRYSELHPSVEAIDKQMKELSREMAGVEDRAKKLPEVEQNVLRLNREVKINTDLYTNLLSAAQQLRLETESKIGSVRMLDTAVVPILPVKPKRLVIIAIAGAIGVVLGILAAFARKTVYRRLDAPQEIERLLGLPVTATIPHSENQAQLAIQNDKSKASVLPLDGPSDSALESLRRFRTSLQFAMLNSKNNIIMITGPTLGVGKSFVSANFATILASIGKRVLLIDGDLRAGRLHRYFGVHNKNGLSDIITGKIMFGSAIHKSVAENVDFISTGDLPRKPSELLAHENFEKLLQLLATRYDYILIDTAPVLAVSDALVIGSHAGVIFNVVRGGVTTAGEVEESVKRMNQAGHVVTGVVFNDAKSRSSARYTYDYAYEQYRILEA